MLVTVPANPDSHLRSPSLAGAKPVVEVRGGLVRKEGPEFIITECLLNPVVAQRLGRVRKILVEARERGQFGLLIPSAVCYIVILIRTIL